MYIDEVVIKIHFLSSKDCVAKFCYSDLIKAEFDKNTLFLYFVGEKRLSVPFFYKKEDFGHLSSMMTVILG